MYQCICSVDFEGVRVVHIFVRFANDKGKGNAVQCNAFSEFLKGHDLSFPCRDDLTRKQLVIEDLNNDVFNDRIYQTESVVARDRVSRRMQTSLRHIKLLTFMELCEGSITCKSKLKRSIKHDLDGEVLGNIDNVKTKENERYGENRYTSETRYDGENRFESEKSFENEKRCENEIRHESEHRYDKLYSKEKRYDENLDGNFKNLGIKSFDEIQNKREVSNVIPEMKTELDKMDTDDNTMSREYSQDSKYSKDSYQDSYQDSQQSSYKDRSHDSYQDNRHDSYQNSHFRRDSRQELRSRRRAGMSFFAHVRKSTAEDIPSEKRNLKPSSGGLLETPSSEMELPEMINPKSQYEDIINEKSELARQHENEDYAELLKSAFITPEKSQDEESYNNDSMHGTPVNILPSHKNPTHRNSRTNFQNNSLKRPGLNSLLGDGPGPSLARTDYDEYGSSTADSNNSSYRNTPKHRTRSPSPVRIWQDSVKAKYKTVGNNRGLAGTMIIEEKMEDNQNADSPKSVCIDHNPSSPESGECD